MGKPATLLEDLCRYALSLGADSIEVERKDGCKRVFARKGNAGFGIVSYDSSSAEARRLRQNLYAAARKTVRTVLGGQSSVLRVRVFDSFGDDAFEVSIRPERKPDRSTAPSFTAKQGQYLAYIHYYTKMNRRPPAETDMQRYFQVTPPSVHQMVVTLELKGFIERVPGQGRSIRLLIPREQLPDLE